MFFPVFLQLLLRKKAAEELKKEQERKAAERRRVIDQRCGKPKSLDGIGEGERGGGAESNDSNDDFFKQTWAGNWSSYSPPATGDKEKSVPAINWTGASRRPFRLDSN